MTELDTSGTVDGKSWDDLGPFTQGYIRKMMSDSVVRLTSRPLRFDMIAPETLGLIIADCEAILVQNCALYDQIYDGDMVWKNRQRGHIEELAPLTLEFGYDQKVHFL